MKIFFKCIIGLFIISFIALYFMGSGYTQNWFELPYIYAVIVIFGLLTFWLLALVVVFLIWLVTRLKEVIK